VTLSAPLRLAFVEEAGEVERNRRSDISTQAELARNAEIREEIVRLADEGQADKAAQILQERKESLKLMAPAAPALMQAEVENEAKKFEALAGSLKEEGGLSSEDRKRTLNEAYIQKNQQ